MEINTAWVKPPLQIGGLDHLAVQAPCVNIYGRLLPGITNVTDRARYYSFYPWLIWAFDKEGYRTYNDEFIERFRRADCLFTLISERHAIVSEDDYYDHAGAMIGSNTLAQVAKELKENGSLILSVYSLREGAKRRYFKNTLGGFSQYYIGVLRELSIVDGDATRGVQYTRQFGQVIAEQMDQGVNRKLFLDVVERDNVTASELDTLSDFCPCQLKNNSSESQILCDLFFNREKFFDVEALPRRRTLQAILQLAELLDAENSGLDEYTFRGCVYSGALPSGKMWNPPETVIPNRNKWAVYARNELLSIAVQGLFYAVLDAYAKSQERFHTPSQIAEWFVEQDEIISAVNEIGSTDTYLQLVEKSGEWLPPRSQWSDINHEIQLSENVVKLCKASPSSEQRQNIVVSSLKILIALTSHDEGHENPYGELVFEEDYFRYYRVNLRSFNLHSKSTWNSLQTSELLKWIATTWGIDNHLHVALRKLHGKSQSTFRIRPSDRGMEVISVPGAVHTRPRFNQALRVLKDIGALHKTDSGHWVPSEIGKSILEKGDAP